MNNIPQGVGFERDMRCIAIPLLYEISVQMHREYYSIDLIVYDRYVGVVKPLTKSAVLDLVSALKMSGLFQGTIKVKHHILEGQKKSQDLGELSEQINCILTRCSR